MALVGSVRVKSVEPAGHALCAEELAVVLRALPASKSTDPVSVHRPLTDEVLDDAGFWRLADEASLMVSPAVLVSTCLIYLYMTAAVTNPQHQVAACPMAGDGTAVEVANTQLTCHINKPALAALHTLLQEAHAAAPPPQAPAPTPAPVPTVEGGVLNQLQPNAFASIAPPDGQHEPSIGGRWFGRQGPGSTDSSEGPSSSRDPSEPGALRSPQVIENFVAPGAGGAPQATGALDLDVWHTDGDWEAPDHYGSWFVVPEGQAAFAVAVSHDGDGSNAEEEPSEPITAPRGSIMPAALYPDYVAVGPSMLGCADAPKPLCARCAIAPLGPLFPLSQTRFVARDVSVLVRLLRDGPATATEAASALVEVDAPRVCLQLDVFAPGQLHARCLSIAVHELELRDWGVEAEGCAEPRVLLGPFSLNRATSGGDACVLHVVLQEVCPDAQHGGVEMRVTAACAALRMQLDQGTLLLMEELGGGVGGGVPAPEDNSASRKGLIFVVIGRFFNVFNILLTSMCSCVCAVQSCLVVPCALCCSASMTHPPAGASVAFFQHCEIAPLRLVFDYRPHRFDLAALRAGRLLELLNLVPLGGVDLQLPGVVLGARKGGGALAAGLLSHWLDDITSTQVCGEKNKTHEKIVGVPLRGVAVCVYGGVDT